MPIQPKDSPDADVRSARKMFSATERSAYFNTAGVGLASEDLAAAYHDFIDNTTWIRCTPPGKSAVPTRQALVVSMIQSSPEPTEAHGQTMGEPWARPHVRQQPKTQETLPTAGFPFERTTSSGRRDSNSRPSPWQTESTQLADLQGRVEILDPAALLLANG